MSQVRLDSAIEDYAAVKSQIEALGRDPNEVKITNLTFPVVGRTMAEAEDRRAAYDELPTLVDDLSLLSEGLNFDFASRELDEPLSDPLLQPSSRRDMRTSPYPNTAPPESGFSGAFPFPKPAGPISPAPAR